MLAFIDIESRIPLDHPLRTIKYMADGALAEVSPLFDDMYAEDGRPSIPSERLLQHQVAREFFDAVVRRADERGLLTDEHFTVDGTLIEAAASLKSFRPKDEPPSPPPPEDTGNPTVNFRGERRSNATHQSATDPDARLAKKGRGKEAHLAFLGHALMENRNALLVDFALSEA